MVLAAYIARHILRRTRRRTAPASRQAKATQAQDDSKTTTRNRRFAHTATYASRPRNSPP